MKVSQNFLFYLGVALLFLTLGVILAFGAIKFDDWRVFTSEKLLIESQKTDNQEKAFILLEEASLLNPNETNYLYTGVKAQELGFNKIAAYYLSRVKTAVGLRELANIYSEAGRFELAEKNYKKSIEKENNPDTWFLLAKNYLRMTKVPEANYSFEKVYEIDNSNSESLYYMIVTNLILDPNYEPSFDGIDESSKEKLVELLSSKTVSTRINRLYLYIKELGYPQLARDYLTDKYKGGKLDRDGCLLLANELYLDKNYSASYQVLLKAKEIDGNYPQIYQHLVEIAELLDKKEEVESYKSTLKLLTWQ